VSLLKRWLLGTHAGAIRPKHLQAYLDEFAFRSTGAKPNGVGRIAARTIERPPLTMEKLIPETVPCRNFRS
jgi:ISXO2-like transposase domain